MIRFSVCCFLLTAGVIVASAQTTTTVVIDSPSPVVIANFDKGDTLTVSAELDTTDPNENGEGEPLSVYSSTGFSCPVSNYAISQFCGTFVAPAAGTLSAYIVGADGDESGTITITINAAPLKLGIFSPGVLDALDKAGDGLDVGAGIGAAVATACAASIIGGPICTLPVGIVSAIAVLAGVSLNVLAKDPSDPNFMVIATPVIPSIPMVTSSGTITQAEANAFNALFTNEIDIAAYTTALTTSLNRAQGAADAGNTNWLNQQLNAVATYKTALIGFLNSEIGFKSTLAQLLAADPNFSSFMLTSAQALQAESLISTSGLPASITSVLNSLGVDSATQTTITNLFIVQNVTTEAGNVAANITTGNGVTGQLSTLAALLSQPQLSGNITNKSGPSNARAWTITLTDNGQGPVYGSQINSMTLTQTSGAACTPTITNPTTFPLTVGNITPTATGTTSATLNFTGCPATARFMVQIGFSADNGASTGTVTRANQFQ